MRVNTSHNTNRFQTQCTKMYTFFLFLSPLSLFPLSLSLFSFFLSLSLSHFYSSWLLRMYIVFFPLSYAFILPFLRLCFSGTRNRPVMDFLTGSCILLCNQRNVSHLYVLKPFCLLRFPRFSRLSRFSPLTKWRK